MDSSLRFRSLGEVPYVYDRFLPAGRCEMDMNGVWHIGQGTDLGAALFAVNLTHFDRRFLHALKIGTE